MNGTFSITRLGMVFRWDFFTYWKMYLRLMLAMAIGLELYFLSSSGISNWEGSSRFVLPALAGGVQFIGLIFMVFGASSIFTNMKTKQQREAFLMLPASNVEKYIVRWCVATLGMAILFMLAGCLADAVFYLYCLAFKPEIHGSVMALFFSTTVSDYTLIKESVLFGVDNSSSLAIFTAMVCLLSLLAHAFFILGGTLFRRHAVLLTIGSGFILLFIGMTILVRLPRFMMAWVADSNMDMVCLAFMLFLVALIVCFYWLSYKLFTRMQIINNKWLNL